LSSVRSPMFEEWHKAPRARGKKRSVLVDYVTLLLLSTELFFGISIKAILSARSYKC
jgi:hypothetical protein